VFGNVKIIVRLQLRELDKIGVLDIAIVKRIFHPPSPVIGRKPALDRLPNEAPSRDECRTNDQDCCGVTIVEAIREIPIGQGRYGTQQILHNIHDFLPELMVGQFLDLLISFCGMGNKIGISFQNST
jgi:hypothetical protein